MSAWQYSRFVVIQEITVEECGAFLRALQSGLFHAASRGELGAVAQEAKRSVFILP